MKRLTMLLALLLVPLASKGDTIVSGSITSNTTWSLDGSPYILSGDVTVGSPTGATLTVLAGVVVKGNANSRLSINVSERGALVVSGTQASPVVFTANAANPAAGFWRGLRFGAVAGAPPSSVIRATIEYGGSSFSLRGGAVVEGNAPSFQHVTFRNNQFCGLQVLNGTPSLTSCTLTANAGDGLRFSGGGATLSDVAFTGNSGAAVSAPVSTELLGMTGLSASGNGVDGIVFSAGTIAVNRTWRRSAIPYHVMGNVTVAGAAVPLLTIESGNTIRFSAGAQLLINSGAAGGLRANGTLNEPITFTSNGPATPGHWRGIRFSNAGGAPASSLAYATIEYAGDSFSLLGAVSTSIGNLSLDRLTLRDCEYAGFRVDAGSPSITNSTITRCGTGVIVTSGGPSISDTAFVDNSGAAVSAPATTQFLGMTGLSATGNGVNGIVLSTAVIGENRTWRKSAIPYHVAGSISVRGTEAPVLTIEAGNTIRFAVNTDLNANVNGRGAIVAIGTAAEPIRFTSNGPATPGHWRGIRFGNTTGAPVSTLSHATIEYGGSAFLLRGGLAVDGGAPQLDHLTLQHNDYAGMTATVSTCRISNSSFSGNDAGIITGSSSSVAASLNYWSSENGPCLSGCAPGQQSVSARVSYEPWLLSAPATPQFVASASQKNRVFSPAIAARTTIDYTTALPGDVTFRVRNAAGSIVRTIAGGGTPGSFVWDGKNDAGSTVNDGTYHYELAAVAQSQPPAAIARGIAVVDSTRNLVLGPAAATFPHFSPNGDGVQDTTAVSSTVNYDDASWTATVRDGASTLLFSTAGAGMPISFTWDGHDSGGNLQPDGAYAVRIEAFEGTATAQSNTTVTVDNTPPVVAITAPSANTVFSNVYGNAGPQSVTGTATDANLQSWALHFGSGAAPTAWTQLAAGTTSITGTLGTWTTLDRANGVYTFRLRAADRAGNAPEVVVSPLSVGHFKVTQSAYQFNAGAGATLTYTSIVPFPLTETLTIRNESGAVVRTLVSAARAAGTYADVFDGRDDKQIHLPDGPYFYIAAVTDGQSSLTWDLSHDYRNDYSGFNDNLNVEDYDPFDNRPLKFTYSNFTQPGRVTIAMSTTSAYVNGNCLAPTETFFCPVYKRWQESGPHTFTWPGLDPFGVYRAIKGVAIVTSTSDFPKNAAVLYGTRPVLANVKVTPAVFGPASGQQTVELDLSTFQSRPVRLTVELFNLATKAVLRTIEAPAQAAGHVVIPWDGRADNGLFLAAGHYRVLVRASDETGNVAEAGILTTIQY